jgi:hypothetical protein
MIFFGRLTARSGGVPGQQNNQYCYYLIQLLSGLQSSRIPVKKKNCYQLMTARLLTLLFGSALQAFANYGYIAHLADGGGLDNDVHIRQSHISQI